MKKCRPCLVVSVDSISSLALKIIVPITAFKASFIDKHWIIEIKPDLENGLSKDSVLDCFQVRCIAEERFKKKLGYIKLNLLADVIGAIGLVVGI